VTLMLAGSASNVALIVCAAVTFVNVYDVIDP